MAACGDAIDENLPPKWFNKEFGYLGRCFAGPIAGFIGSNAARKAAARRLLSSPQ